MTRALENDVHGARAARAAALLLLLPSLAGCCIRASRSDDGPSFDYSTGVFAERFDDDAVTTTRRISNVWPSIEADFDETGSRFQTACDLYFDN